MTLTDAFLGLYEGCSGFWVVFNQDSGRLRSIRHSAPTIIACRGFICQVSAHRTYRNASQAGYFLSGEFAVVLPAKEVSGGA